MRKISAYSFKLALILAIFCQSLNGQDTIPVTLRMRAGIDLSGPVRYAAGNDIFEAEGYVALDLNEKVTAVAEAGYLDYRKVEYNYEYLNKGFFAETGFNYNILNLAKAKGRYYGGLGLRYGISRYSDEVPYFYSENYWGRAEGAINLQTNWAHYLEFSPGVRAELLKNLSIGWSLNIRMLLYTGSPDDFRPVYIPGFGNAGQMFSTGFRYYLELSIPWKRKTVIIPKEEPEEETEEPVENPPRI
ncbi:MAG: DUF6048 family protein [Bacteroidales bacterium]|nr:DUF6048 family protein [Bacteroidales bacterium]